MTDAQDPRSFLTSGEEAIIRHWTTYGQRGTTPTERAMPWSWIHAEFLDPKSAEWDVPLKAHQTPLLLLGYTPSDPPNDQLLISETFTVGDTIQTHGFMSTSANPNVKASEDKWFIYAVGPDPQGHVRLIMCRSWTGIKQIELKYTTGDIDANGNVGDAKITHIIWDADPNQWRGGMDEKTAKEVATEILRWVMRVDLYGSEGYGQPALSEDSLIDAVGKIPPTPGTVYSQRSTRPKYDIPDDFRKKHSDSKFPDDPSLYD